MWDEGCWMKNRACCMEGGWGMAYPLVRMIADKWSGMEQGCRIDFGLSR